ncbi:uncharacterized protein DS421_12g365460 [Arachis hypogaea]|nr:uncharacterized protein DS421_12g365460 [Arachis hypogaea]
MSWIGPTRLLKSLATFALSGSCATIGASAYRARARPYARCNYGKSYIISKPRMLAFQPNWNRINWTSVAQVMVV